jgi:hypothetical protein
VNESSDCQPTSDSQAGRGEPDYDSDSDTCLPETVSKVCDRVNATFQLSSHFVPLPQETFGYERSNECEALAKALQQPVDLLRLVGSKGSGPPQRRQYPAKEDRVEKVNSIAPPYPQPW